MKQVTEYHTMILFVKCREIYQIYMYLIYINISLYLYIDID